MRTLNTMLKAEQLALVDKISSITELVLKKPVGDLDRFHRDGQIFFRLRADDYRIYFEQTEEQLKCHYILHKNTLSDFIFRCKLPIGDEQMLEQHKSFWQYLESLGKNS